MIWLNLLWLLWPVSGVIAGTFHSAHAQAECSACRGDRVCMDASHDIAITTLFGVFVGPFFLLSKLHDSIRQRRIAELTAAKEMKRFRKEQGL